MNVIFSDSESLAQTNVSNADVVRLSNTALGNHYINTSATAQLKYFSLDWLAFFINSNFDSEIKRVFDAIFKEYEEIEQMPLSKVTWFNTKIEFDVQISKGKGDLHAYLYYEGEKLIAIRKITNTSTYPSSVTHRFQYLLTFYGTFFVYQKLGLVSLESFIDIALKEEEEQKSDTLLSLLHICIDVSHLSPKQVFKGIKHKSISHAKPYSQLETDPITKEYQTIVIGKKSDNHHTVVYNKLQEIRDDKSERKYKEYYGLKQVTRTELKVKSTNLRKFNFSLRDCLDMNKLLGIVKRHYRTNFISWNLYTFLEKELGNKNIIPANLDVVNREYNPLDKNECLKRCIRSIYRFIDRYDADKEDTLNHIVDHVTNNSYI